MKPVLHRLCIASAALILSVPVWAETVVMEYRGTESRNSPEFEVKAPWILDWRISTNGAYESAVDISMEEAGTSIHQGSVLMTKYPGNGVKLFQSSGRFYFRVSSSFATWNLKVIELTEEEAALYTPRERGVLNR